MISNLECLVDELSSLPATDLDLDTRALVHLHVWLLFLLQSSNLRFYRLYQALQLVCHLSLISQIWFGIVWRIISFSLQSYFVVFGQNSHQWVLRELLLCLRLALVFVWLNVFLLLVMSLLYVWRGQALLLFICTEMIKINNGLCIWYNLKLAPPRPSFLTFR